MGMSLIRIEGYRFTWGNNREEEGYVEEVLDKAFGSLSWMTAHPQAKVTNIFRSSSDHGMLLLHSENGDKTHKARFVFYKRWIQRRDITEVVSTVWREAESGTPFFILKTRMALSNWSRNFRADNKRNIKSLAKGLYKEIRSGRETKILDHSWVPSLQHKSPKPLNSENEDLIWVHDMINEDGRH
ncbi:retrotransposon protein [Striga asiatica]|uniref:Retrotransposon protein n=1 Tax=Striga asiatica TaxID=4170 RepID=A0A5A7R5Z5_STRAF|nr:retrotransposon protein [Striga asiatica]